MTDDERKAHTYYYIIYQPEMSVAEQDEHFKSVIRDFDIVFDLQNGQGRYPFHEPIIPFAPRIYAN